MLKTCKTCGAVSHEAEDDVRLDKLSDLIDDEKYEDAHLLLDELKGDLGEYYSEIIRLQTFLELMELHS